MSRLRVGRIGIALNVSADDTYLDEAAEAERLGYSTIWLPGGQIDSLDRIAKLVRATRRIPVASAIISADVFPPDAVRDRYADLQATAPDRFVAGLESPLVPRVLDQASGVLRGHDELRHFFVRGTEGRPN